MSKTSSTSTERPESAAIDSSEGALSNDHTTISRRKRELVYGAVAFVAGFVVLPILIYIVGVLALGPYAGGKTLGDFFAEFYRNLGGLTLRTWFIALSPYIAFWLVRLAFRPWGRRPPGTAGDVASPDSVAQRPTGSERREPFIGA